MVLHVLLYGWMATRYI